MKKALSCLCVWAICASGAYAMNDSLPLNSNAKKTMRRINSEANMLLFEEDNKLPQMSRGEYMSMMEKFLTDNSRFLDFSNWILQLKSLNEWNDEFLAWVMDRFPKVKKFGDNKIDISCPRIVESAMVRLATVEAKKPDISADTALTMENLKWILENFDKHLKDIQAHGDMPIIHYGDDVAPYDSGLSDVDIELLISLTIGKHKLFRVSGLTEDEMREFIDLQMKPMLRNATGFQHVISLIVVSVLNQADGITNDHIDINTLKGSRGSHQRGNSVNINKGDDFSLDMTLFHETRHAFHRMLGLSFGIEEIISNISIVNSNNINLIDQFFPMLRPSTMFDAVANIEKFIKGYWGSKFENIDQADRERLIVLFLEPALRNIVISGFGSLIPYCKDWTTKPLTVTEDALTSENMAWCIYLSTMLNKNILDPVTNEDGSIKIPTNKSENYNKSIHPTFYNLQIVPAIVTEKVHANDIFGRDSLWNTTEEKLCMQGSTLYQTSDGYSYYIEDKQNEQIYLIRSGKHDSSIPILYRYRFHQKSDQHMTFLNIFQLVCRCISSSDKDWYQEIKNSPAFDRLESRICINFLPSLKEKYSTNEKVFQNIYFEDMPIDEEAFKKFENAMSIGTLDRIYGKYQEDVSHTEAYDDFVRQKVQALINQGLPVNVRNKWNETPLPLVSEMNFSKTKELLIRDGAIDVEDFFLDEDFEDIEKRFSVFLEENGIMLDEKAFAKWQEAIESFKYDEILGKYYTDDRVASVKYYDNLAKREVESLIKQCVPINVKNEFGETPLLNALNAGFLETAQLLIDNDAKVNARDVNGNSILHSLNHLSEFSLINEAVQLLLRNDIDINEKNRNGKTPLHCAVNSTYPNKSLVNALVENGADIDAIDYDGNTPMHTAVRNNCAETVDILKLLLAKNADINVLNHRKETPLFELLSGYKSTIDNTMIEISEFMLDRGAKLDAKNNAGNTILHAAVENRHYIKNIERLIESLLKHGADINCINYAGNTPLHLAVKSYQLDTVKFLIANKARTNIKNYDGFTPIELAIRLFWNEAVEFFINNVDINSKDAIDIFRFAVEENNVNVIKILESKEFDIKKQYDEFNTLELAIEHNANEVAKLFIDDIDVASPYAERLFRIAATHSNPYIVEFFAKKGINVNAGDENGNTAAHLAVRNCAKAFKDLLGNRQDLEETTLKILETIKRFNGDFSLTNDQGIMPIQLALSSEDIFTLLNNMISSAIDLCKEHKQQLLMRCEEIAYSCSEQAIFSSVLGMKSVTSFLVRQYATNKVKEAIRND